jgi:dTMP kinase
MPAAHDLRGVLRIRSFRRLWIALSFSSLGDWLGLLATSALAFELVSKGHSQSAATIATGGVFFFRLLPALLLGPIAGAFADRFDRRITMVICDTVRCGMFVSIALVHSLWYLFGASFLIESVSLFWIPAKDASVPNLVPRHRLESANQLSLITTYGTAPIAAVLFALLARFNDALAHGIRFFSTNPTDLAIYLDAATFLFSAITISTLREISGRRTPAGGAAEGGGIIRSIVEGWRYVGSTPLVRGLIFGILGAFAAAGVVIALARPFSEVLGGGNAGYGVLFASVFTGLATGMFLGPRLLNDFSRLRLFSLAIILGGAALAVLAILPNLVVAALWTAPVGAFAGIAWVVGYTLLGGEVDDEIRGRTFALVQSLARVILLVVIAAAPVIAGGIGEHHVDVSGLRVRLDGVTLTLLAAGMFGIVVGLASYRQMDDGETPLWRDLVESVRRMPSRHGDAGCFVVFEGGEGAGKSTQVRLLAEWFARRDTDVVVTREPGATAVGAAIRQTVLDPATQLSPQAEALLYAADRADHVAQVIRPALRRGAVVLCDRFVDSSLAYQGVGRDLGIDEVSRFSAFATGGLVPDLTVVLDIPPEVGLARCGTQRDRLEGEPLAFHAAVRKAFLDLAARQPARYVVVDATLPAEQIAAVIRRRLAAVLPRTAPPRDGHGDAAAVSATAMMGPS